MAHDPSRTTAAQPALFVSHGSPMTALDDGASGQFLRTLGPWLRQRWGTPRAILALSAHSLARELTLLAAPQHEAVYDFGGFDPALRTLRYDAPGAPEIARDIDEHLTARGWSLRRTDAGGLDHGIWTPLRHAFPDANIPVLPLAWNPRTTPAELMRLGRDLADLCEQGVMILTSGSITHNLGLFMREPQPMYGPEREESRVFRQWWAARAAEADWSALQDWARQAPHAALMHPTDEHLLPFFVAAGVGQARSSAGVRLHEGAQHGVIGMDAYAFHPGLQADPITAGARDPH